MVSPIGLGTGRFAIRRVTDVGLVGTDQKAIRERASSYLMSRSETGDEHMGKLAVVATIKTIRGRREEYLKHLQAHAQRCLTTEPGTLNFEILVPHELGDTTMLYEVYESPKSFRGALEWPV